MADAALRSFEDLLENVPLWIADIEGILGTSTERQNEILFEQQPVDEQPVVKKKQSKSSSLKSFRSGDSKKKVEDAKTGTPEPTLLRPRIPHMTESDALRLAQRKRKTASVCSRDQSGPSKYRTRAMVVIYYDGNVQKKFESLVRSIGSCRNAIRKGKMGAKVDRLSRQDSSGSESSARGSDNGCVDLDKLGYRSTRTRTPGSGLFGKDDVVASFDRVDNMLEQGQSLCERAAHQILRDGDCTQELKTANGHFADAKTAAAAELPALQKRADKAIERQRRSDERRRVDEEAGESEPQADVSSSETLLASFAPTDGKLEVDLEVDDSEDDGDDFVAGGLNLGRYQSSFTARTSSSIGKPRKASKPSSRIVEIPSDEMRNDAALIRRGPLRGINPNNVIVERATPLQESIEVQHGGDDDDIPDENELPRASQRSTRAARSGKPSMKYDQSYHPMDDVTRPKRAAKRKARTRSVSPPAKTRVEISSDESELEDEHSDEDSDSQAKKPDLPSAIKQHPGATRRSARPARNISYPQKSHDQDEFLPGFQHRAKRVKQARISAASRTAHLLEKSDEGPTEEPGDRLVSHNSPEEERQRPDVSRSSRVQDQFSIPALSMSSGSEDDQLNDILNTFEQYGNDSQTSMEHPMNDFPTERIVLTDQYDRSTLPAPSAAHVEETDDTLTADAFAEVGTIPHDDASVINTSAGSGPRSLIRKTPGHSLTEPVDVCLTIVKPYLHGFTPYVLKPRDLQFRFATHGEYSHVHSLLQTQVDHSFSSESSVDDSVVTPVVGPERRLANEQFHIAAHGEYSHTYSLVQTQVDHTYSSWCPGRRQLTKAA